jgi:hypothetical protein
LDYFTSSVIDQLMEKDKKTVGTETPGQNDQAGRDQSDDKNPFKDADLPNQSEGPVEDAEAEQQRKDALTERD